MIVAPSILSADFSKLKEEVIEVASFGADFLHIDIMDGHFVPNITIGSCVVKSIRDKVDTIFDVHLMISNPEKYYEDFITAGADIITFHLEANEDPLSIIRKIKEKGIKAGMSIKPSTDVRKLLPYLTELDLVLIMSVEPGFGGQEFMENALDKISFLSLYKEKNHLDFLIEVDGGINLETGKKCAEAGCEVLVAGSYIFKANDRREKVASLLKL